MEPNKWFTKQLDAYRNDVEYQTELIQIEIMEQIVAAMKQKNISRTKISKKLGRSTAHKTKLLHEKSNG
ncbi:MAG: hypothetical protein HYZ34_02960 [Ignavibacteriae bacterium]|nr:hypothetical protein [Ignavibacteriota bacterium]